MEKLDFSGISTEQLRHACDEYFLNKGCACIGISCNNNDCPLSKQKYCSGDNVTYGDVNKLFKEELNRREKDMNEMPELVSGMIVELYNVDRDINYGLYLHIENEWNISISKNEHCPINDNVKVVKIYKANTKTWDSLENNNSLIWSRKSDNDIKIEELQESITNLEDNHSKAVAEIKNKIEELKG